MTTNEKFMKRAILEAKKALNENEVPIGAVIVSGGKIVSCGHNRRETSRDATDHAEIIAIKRACRKMNDFRLVDADMYVTLEPCLMCFGAILNARIKNLYIGAPQNKENAIRCEELNERAELNHKCTIHRGILEGECAALVSGYFLDKRKG